MGLEPERTWLWFGLVGAITFGLTWTAIIYVFQRELTWVGVVGGISWFVISLVHRRWIRERDKLSEG